MPNLMPSTTTIRRKIIVGNVIDMGFEAMLCIWLIYAMIIYTGLFSVLATVILGYNTFRLCKAIDRSFRLAEDVEKEVANQKFLNQLMVQRAP